MADRGTDGDGDMTTILVRSHSKGLLRPLHKNRTRLYVLFPLPPVAPPYQECGPGCPCGPSCENRVTQQGVVAGLNIFKTIKVGSGA